MGWIFVKVKGVSVETETAELMSFFEARKYAQKILRDKNLELVRFGSEDSDVYHELTPDNR